MYGIAVFKFKPPIARSGGFFVSRAESTITATRLDSRPAPIVSVAQLAEHRSPKPKVVRSIRTRPAPIRITRKHTMTEATQALNAAIASLSAAAAACHEREQALIAQLTDKDAQLAAQSAEIATAAQAVAATAVALNPAPVVHEAVETPAETVA